MTQSCKEWWIDLTKNQQTIFIIVVMLVVVALFFSFNCNSHPDKGRGPLSREVPPYITSF